MGVLLTPESFWVRHHEGVPRPSFRSYLRIMRNKPGFGFGLVAVVCFCTRNALEEGVVGALVSVVIGCAIGVAMFPWWRRKASQDPFTYTTVSLSSSPNRMRLQVLTPRSLRATCIFAVPRKARYQSSLGAG